MVIYRVRMWVNKRGARGKNVGKLERVAECDKVVVDNLEYARSLFTSMKSELDTWKYMAYYSGKVELFIPHIHTNGLLAYWPDNGQYIDKWELEQ